MSFIMLERFDYNLFDQLLQLIFKMSPGKAVIKILLHQSPSIPVIISQADLQIPFAIILFVHTRFTTVEHLKFQFLMETDRKPLVFQYTGIWGAGLHSGTSQTPQIWVWWIQLSQKVKNVSRDEILWHLQDIIWKTKPSFFHNIVFVLALIQCKIQIYLYCNMYMYLLALTNSASSSFLFSRQDDTGSVVVQYVYLTAQIQLAANIMQGTLYNLVKKHWIMKRGQLKLLIMFLKICNPWLINNVVLSM